MYVANDFYAPDRLYRNNGDGTFTDVAAEALPHTPWFSMGCDVGDINNDGLFDFIGTDMSERTDYRAKVAMNDMFDDWLVPGAAHAAAVHAQRRVSQHGRRAACWKSPT